MSFCDVIQELKSIDFEGYFENVTDEDIQKSIGKDKLTYHDFLNLLSERAENYLEEMAQKAHRLTIQYFGRTISLYIPLYISNYCNNKCIYCGFNRSNKISRKKLSLQEIENEVRKIAETEMKHILVLTGEAKEVTPLDYIEDSIRIIRKYFPSVSIEMFPMDEDNYKSLKNAGVDGLTIYQEVYDETVYRKVHLSGKKTDYRYRLDTPERGAKAGFRMVNIGTLFGLGEKRKEAFFSGMHAKYLYDKYLDTEISLSLPRINEAEGGFRAYDEVDDSFFVQIMLAYRLFLPRVGITVSTRERAEFRDRLIYLGATRFSAGSRTEVGGYSKREEKTTPQFEISDNRDVDEIVRTIKEKGYQPVFKDWDLI